MKLKCLVCDKQVELIIPAGFENSVINATYICEEPQDKAHIQARKDREEAEEFRVKMRDSRDRWMDKPMTKEEIEKYLDYITKQ